MQLLLFTFSNVLSSYGPLFSPFFFFLPSVFIFLFYVNNISNIPIKNIKFEIILMLSTVNIILVTIFATVDLAVTLGFEDSLTSLHVCIVK